MIHMKKNFKELELLFPKEFKIEEFRNTLSEEPFSNESINFLDVLSKNLLNDKKSKLYPDVATFGFYCRKANIIKLKEKYVNTETILLQISTLLL